MNVLFIKGANIKILFDYLKNPYFWRSFKIPSLQWNDGKAMTGILQLLPCSIQRRHWGRV